MNPVNKVGKSSGIFGHSQMGATIVDSLDTLLVMGMKEEFARAREWVEKKLDFSQVNLHACNMCVHAYMCVCVCVGCTCVCV